MPWSGSCAISEVSAGARTVSGVLGEHYSCGNFFSGSSELAAGRYSRQLSTEAASPVFFCPGFIRQQVFEGLPYGSQVSVRFGRPMNPESLSQALQLYQLSDASGGEFRNVSPFLTTYDASENIMNISDLRGRWEPGAFYELIIDTRARTADGMPLTASLTVNFRALLHPGMAYRIYSRDRRSSLVIPSGALTRPAVVSVVTKDDAVGIQNAVISEANRKAADFSMAGPVEGSITRVIFLEADGSEWSGGLASDAQLELSYPQDGRAFRLRAHRLDEQRALWVQMPSGGLSSDTGKFRIPLRTFSLFSLLAVPDCEVSQSYAFPVPWRPNDGNAANGDASGVTFVNLPVPARVKVFTVDGGKAWDAASTGPSLVWDGRSESGRPVASGVYLWMVEAGPNRKVGKLMVIR